MAVLLRYHPLPPQLNRYHPPSLSFKTPSPATSFSYLSFPSPVFHKRFLFLTSSPAASASSSAALESPPSEPEAVLNRTRLIAQNVPWDSTLDDVRCLFERYGTVTDIEEFEGRVIKVEFARAVKKKKSPPPPKKDIKGHNLFVGNLTWGVKTGDLKELFGAQNDEILSAEVVYQTNPRGPAGYGFVSFVSKEAAEAAITAFNGKKLMGRAIQLGFSKSQVTGSDVELKEETDGQNS